MSQVSERDSENLGKLLKYADEKEEDVEKLSEDFANKGFLGLRWDSKVPDEDKRPWNFFSLKISNPEEVVSEMKIYHTFFKEVSEAVYKVLDPEKMSDAEKNDPEEITDKLHKKLLEMNNIAKEGILNTSSSALYKLHQSFVKQYVELKNLITGTESVVLRKVKNYLYNKCVEANERINVLEKRLNDSIEKHNKALKEFDEAVRSYKTLYEDQKKVVKENGELRGKVQNLEKKTQEQLEENHNLKKEVKDLWEAISELRKKK